MTPEPARAAELAANLAALRARIAAAERAHGRAPDSVRLVAVSKTMPAEDVAALLAAGQLDFGENYAQELRDKRAALAAYQPAPRWHYIGPLQSNKVKYLASGVALVHALDDPALCDELNRRVPEGQPLDCLVQVNVAAEPGKRGVAPARLPTLLDHFATTPRLRCVGLMTLPPFADDPWAVAPHFRALAELAAREAGRARAGVALRELSMGMSHDLEVAIACGATLVRVGTALFGARPRPGAR